MKTGRVKALESPSQMRERVSYNPETGALTWLARSSPRWNSRHAGKPAFNNPSQGYLIGRMDHTNYKAHRVAWAVHYGEWPAGQIDHINGVRSDNRLENLRVVSNAENGRNQRRRTTNRTGEPCVNWYPRDAKWWVKITVNGKQIHVGYFDDFDAAVAARNAAYQEHGFHENHGN